jgi:hypothetical protein
MLQRLRYLANGIFQHAFKYFQVEFICISALFLLLSVLIAKTTSVFSFTFAVVWCFCSMTIFEGSKLPIYNFSVVGNVGSTPDGFLYDCRPETNYILDVCISSNMCAYTCKGNVLMHHLHLVALK